MEKIVLLLEETFQEWFFKYTIKYTDYIQISF